MGLEKRRWRKIVLFCVAVLVVKACLWRGNDVYDQFLLHPPKFSALFVFGDSLADSGNNNNYINVAARANFVPYGKSFFGTPTGRFSDGRTIFDFLAIWMGLPFPAPWFQHGADLDLSKGAKFASGGSGLLDSTFQHLNVISFGRQVDEFRKIFSTLKGIYGHAYRAEEIISESIIAINVGANDIARNYLVNASLSNNVRPEAFIKSLLKGYKNYLLMLHKIGGRKFVVLGISALGCSPGMRYSGLSKWHGGCDETANELFQQFNFGLRKLAHYLNTNLNGSTFIYVNTYDLLLDIIQKGKTLGFGEIVSACCGEGPFNAGVACGQSSEGRVCKDPNEYVFWDAFHPTERVQKMIAEEVCVGLSSSSVSPFNLSRIVPPYNIPSF